MQFISTKYEKNSRIDYIYSVEYDYEKLKEILEKLKNYRCISNNTVYFDDNNKLFKTISNLKIKKRLNSLFEMQLKHTNDTICPETIEIHKDNEKNQIMVSYSFEKYPELYDYINYIINDESVMPHSEIYATGNWKYQLIIEELFSYIDTLKCDLEYTSEEKKKELYELYYETLKCFTFTLTSVQEYYLEGKMEDGLTFQKRFRKVSTELND